MANFNNNNSNPESFLPPGFRFHPTDEELILHYLRNKAASLPCPVSIIAEVDIYKFDPWDLPAKATFGEKEWYFFTPRDRKYPNGARPNRAAVSGYWKATGTDKPILASSSSSSSSQAQVGNHNKNIGVKKALVFYKGRPPKGIKTNWIMHEYRLSEAPSTKHTYKYKDTSMRLDDWVLCRIYRKSNVMSTSPVSSATQEQEEPSFAIRDTISTNFETPNCYSLKPQKSMSFSDLFDAMDYSAMSRIMFDSTIDPIVGFDSTPFNGNILEQSSSSYSSVPQFMLDNNLKRERSDSTVSEEIIQHPSKRFISSSDQFDQSHQHYHLINQNQPFLNQQQQLMLSSSSHLQL
ncbi:hypothetical protein Sjap_001972 [Stephania japonica]|uniref:NAC domain-containing protein n=1 Tax=Stephania japonica TaxID=461633 RepID=A0AAP0PS75_9MAGN